MEENVQYKKYGQYLQGQFRKSSKKAQALFVGRAIQVLTDSIKPQEEKLKLRMDTLRFIIHNVQLTNEQGEEIPGWIRITVAYEVGSYDPYTEEDRKADEERRQKALEARRRAEEESGPAAMEALEREIFIPPAQDQIQ